MTKIKVLQNAIANCDINLIKSILKDLTSNYDYSGNDLIQDYEITEIMFKKHKSISAHIYFAKRSMFFQLILTTPWKEINAQETDKGLPIKQYFYRVSYLEESKNFLKEIVRSETFDIIDFDTNPEKTIKNILNFHKNKTALRLEQFNIV
jgi:hypothetical protein